MGAAVTYSCTALYGTNKTGKLNVDAEGYYDVVLGALNYYNSNGAFYALEPAKALFDSSSILQRRISKGVLRGEYKHPEMVPGMSKKEYLLRVLKIDEVMVSHHIKEVYLDSETMKDKSGAPIVCIRGRIKPSGPYGDALAKALENPSENVYFSIRSLTDDYMDGRGQITKNLLEIVTWDHVNEGGINIANKYDTPTLEHFQSLRFTEDNVALAKNMAMEGYGMESESTQALARVAKHIEASRNMKQQRSGLMLPPSANW